MLGEPTCWLSDVASDAFPPGPAGNRFTEVAIIGGGIMGVSIAYWLAKLGVQTELLEARTLAAGATGRNAGLMLHGSSPLENPAILESVCAEEGLEFGYSKPGHLSLASSPAIWEKIQAEVQRRPASAPPLHALDRASCEALLNMKISRSFHGGRWYPDGAVAHSSRLVYELASAARKYSAAIHCQTRALSVGYSAGGVAIKTNRGTVTANQVVHASAGGVAALLPEMESVFTSVRVQMMATDSIRHVFPVGLGVDWGDVYGRQLPDGKFVLGGFGGEKISYAAETAESTDPAIQSKLAQFLPNAFPAFPDFTVRQRWAGVLDCTRDGKPLIGAHPGRPNHWLIAGFNGHGMPVALGAAKGLAEAVKTGSVPGSLESFNPGRFDPLGRPDRSERKYYA